MNFREALRRNILHLRNPGGTAPSASRRIACTIEVTVEGIRAQTVDFSSGGMRLKISKPLTVGTSCRVALHSLQIESVIVWCRPAGECYHVGLQFTNFPTLEVDEILASFPELDQPMEPERAGWSVTYADLDGKIRKCRAISSDGTGMTLVAGSAMPSQERIQLLIDGDGHAVQKWLSIVSCEQVEAGYRIQVRYSD